LISNSIAIPARDQAVPDENNNRASGAA